MARAANGHFEQVPEEAGITLNRELDEAAGHEVADCAADRLAVDLVAIEHGPQRGEQTLSFGPATRVPGLARSPTVCLEPGCAAGRRGGGRGVGSPSMRGSQ